MLLICGVGVLQIYSATRDTDYTSAWWKQIIYVLGGLFLMWLMMAVDYHSLLHYVPVLYIGSVVALLVTYAHRARRRTAPSAGFRWVSAFTCRYRNSSSW